MTDNPSSAAPVRGGEGPNRNLPVVAPETAPWSPPAPLPEMSYSEAASRRDELYGNTPAAQKWRDEYFAGSVEAKAEMDRITRALTPAPPAPSSPENTDQLVEWAGSIAGDLPADVIEYHLRNRGPVSPHEVKLAQQRKAARMADPDYRQALFDGALEMRQEMLLLDIILSSPIREPETK